MSLNEIPRIRKPPSNTMATQIPHLTLDPTKTLPPTRSLPTSAAYAHIHSHSHAHTPPTSLPAAKTTKQHPTKATGSENASIFFVGNATTILEWEGVRLMTDPNFLHKGDHVHLGPGVTGVRVTDPAVGLDELPRIDVVLLSHYHA
jgi:hypothetical protein